MLQVGVFVWHSGESVPPWLSFSFGFFFFFGFGPYPEGLDSFFHNPPPPPPPPCLLHTRHLFFSFPYWAQPQIFFFLEFFGLPPSNGILSMAHFPSFFPCVSSLVPSSPQVPLQKFLHNVSLDFSWPKNHKGPFPLPL